MHYVNEFWNLGNQSFSSVTGEHYSRQWGGGTGQTMWPKDGVMISDWERPE